MVYYGYHPTKKRLDKNLIKNVVIVVLSIIVVLLLGALVSLKRAYNLREYSIANNCEWVYQNTAYGDDRDYICK